MHLFSREECYFRTEIKKGLEFYLDEDFKFLDIKIFIGKTGIQFYYS